MFSRLPKELKDLKKSKKSKKSKVSGGKRRTRRRKRRRKTKRRRKRKLLTRSRKKRGGMKKNDKVYYLKNRESNTSVPYIIDENTGNYIHEGEKIVNIISISKHDKSAQIEWIDEDENKFEKNTPLSNLREIKILNKEEFWESINQDNNTSNKENKSSHDGVKDPNQFVQRQRSEIKDIYIQRLIAEQKKEGRQDPEKIQKLKEKIQSWSGGSTRKRRKRKRRKSRKRGGRMKIEHELYIDDCNKLLHTGMGQKEFHKCKKMGIEKYKKQKIKKQKQHTFSPYKIN
tara:strand:+ start:309 stop:1166 length:858 start_codon:yes stop_codon:yes gene_type:complete